MSLPLFSYFSVDAYDEDTGYLLHEVYLENLQGENLPNRVKDKITDLKGNESINLVPADVAESHFLRNELSQWTNFPIRLRHELSSVPYRIHGGREFDLMKKGKKPFSVFQNPPPSMNNLFVKYFDPMVNKSGWAVEKTAGNEETFMYALPGEAWRINAYRLLKTIAQAVKWDDTLERLEGALLGYTREQSDVWFDYRKNAGLLWGFQRMYKFITNEEIAEIAKTGWKAFVPDISWSGGIVLYFPHYGSDEHDQRTALFGLQKTPLAKFYIPIVKIIQHSMGIKNIGGVDFEIFEFSKCELMELNREINGLIEIVSPE